MHYCYTNHLCIFFDTGIINTLFNSRVDMTDSPTRENGTPPPEEVDPTTEELDNHGPTQQGGGENHKSSTHDESGEEEDEEDPVEGDAMGLRRLFRQADQHKWSMDTILADHFMEHTRLHLSDADMKVNLEEFPPPDNINAVLHMGTSVKNLLKKEGKNAVVDQDQDWSAVQSRLQDVMGPLGAAWSQCVRLRQKKAEDHEVDIRALGDSLQLSALTLAQAIQKISWYRRVHALSALGNIKNVKDTLKEEKVQQIFEKDTSDNLFPTQFDEHLKAMKGSRQNLVNHFKPEEKKKKKEPPKTNQPKDRRYTNQPFRGAPSRGGYSDGRPSNNNSYFGRNPFYDSSKKKGQGKHASTPFPSQHAFTTRMVADSPTRPSKPRRIVSCKGGDSTTGRKNSEVLGQLEIVDQRPGDSRHSKGVGGTFDRHSNPGQNPSRHTDEQSGESGNGQGGRKYAGQGSHPSGHSQGGPILEQCFRNPKRGGTISPNHKSQEIKRIRTLPPFQNGGIKGRETPTEPRGLDVQNRSERRIFFSPPGNQVTKTSEVQMEGNPVRIPLPSLRSGPSTQNIYQDDEGPGGPPKEIGHSPGHLPGRSTDHGVVSGRGDPGKGHGNVPVSSFGTDHKLEEINSPPIPGTGVLGGHGQQPDHGLFPVKGKETEIDFKVSGNTSEPDNNAEIPVFSHWEVVVDSGSSHTSPAATQISTTIVHKSASSKTALRARNNAFFQRHFGIKMVDREPKPSGGKPASHFTPRSGHLFRCSQDRGWGAVCHLGATGGTWSMEEKQLHINVQELMAAELAIRTFTRDRTTRSIHMKIDNTTALSYLIKMGGTKNVQMIEITKRIWEFLLPRKITLTAEWIPSHMNDAADWESRNVKDSSEWMLCPNIFKALSRTMGQPSIDLFASRVSNQLPRYLSWKADPNCLAVDAFQQDWTQEFPYAFPPFCLITRVLRQVEVQTVKRMILITPLWPTQPWFPLVMAMSIQIPLLLPTTDLLLSGPSGEIHPLLRDSSLNLVAWLVSGIGYEAQEFRKKLQASSSTPVGGERLKQGQSIALIPSGMSSLNLRNEPFDSWLLS